MEYFQSSAKAFFLFAIILLAVDMVWLKGAQSLHQDMVMRVQKSPLIVDKFAGALFYVLAAFVFVHIFKNHAKGDVKSAFMYGAMAGFIMYGTFDLTNKAIFKDYDWQYALKDWAWGTFAMGTSAAIATYLLK